MKLSFKNYSKLTKGFTLIELLIVIAVLGVLAAVLLVAINPLEQLARSRDAGRKSDVEQLGRLMQAYATGTLSNSASTVQYPATVVNWQTAYLVASGDIKAAIAAPANTTNCDPANNQGQSSICYNQLTAGADGVIWIAAESSAEKTKGACAGGTPVAVEAWIISQGKAGVTCVATASTAPAAGATLN